MDQDVKSTPLDTAMIQGPFLVDAHVHVYNVYDRDRFLEAAAENFRMAAAERGLRPHLAGILMLTEDARHNAFQRFAAAAKSGSEGRWTFCRTEEPDSLFACLDGRAVLLVVAGRQIATAERLEVLALGCNDSFDDGQPLDLTLQKVRQSGALAVLPWGFGKWMFGRGARISETISRLDPSEAMLGDNGGRPAILPTPSQFGLARRRGIKILPGTDPLPFASEGARPGSVGFLLDGTLDRRRPAQSLKRLISESPEQPRTYGQPEAFFRFCRNQIRMQLRQRRGKTQIGATTASPATAEVAQEERPAPGASPRGGPVGTAAAGHRPLRALVVSPQPFFSPRGTPLSVYYRTLITAEEGVEVDLLTYGEGQDVAIDGVHIHRIPRFAWLGDVKVGPSLLKLFLDVFLVARAIALLVRHRYDFVHAHEEAIFFCRLLKPLFRFKLVYDMHSCLPRQLTNFKFTKSRFLIGAFERLERTSVRASDAVITICPDLADYALELVDDPGKHILIENSIFEDVKLANAPARSGPASRAEQKLPSDRPLIVYAGTLEPYQGIGLLLEAFNLVRREYPAAFLLVAGGNPSQVDAYQAQASRLGITESCQFTGRLPQAEARRLVARAAVQASPRIHGTNTPLKVYEQLASGIPLVATDICAHRQVLDESVAFLAEPEPQTFARGILAALTKPSERDRRIEAAQRLYAEKYARDAYVGKMRQLLERII